MAHRVHAELAERDPLHLVVCGMVLDPILVAPEPIARMELRGISIRDRGKLVESAAGQRAEPIQMRLKMRAHRGIQVSRRRSRSALSIA